MYKISNLSKFEKRTIKNSLFRYFMHVREEVSTEMKSRKNHKTYHNRPNRFLLLLLRVC